MVMAYRSSCFRCTFACLLALFIAFGSRLASAEPWIITNYSGAHVVIAESADETLHLAAKEFTQLWMRCTGVQINYSASNQGQISIWLGKEVMPTDLVKPEELEGLGDQGFIIRTYKPNRRDDIYRVGPHLVIVGNTSEATLHGVHEFFDRYLGKRWYTASDSNEIYVEKAGIAQVDLRFVPSFRYREVGYFGMWQEEKGMDAFRVALHLPRSFHASLRHPVPASEGESSDDVVTVAERATQWVGEVIEGKAQADGATRTIIWSDESGAPVVCWTLNRIPPLHAAMEKYLAAATEEDLSRVLAVAEAVSAKLQAAHQKQTNYVRLALPAACPLPPKDTTLADGVVVQLTNLHCDFSRPLAEAHTPENKAFVDALAAWSNVANHVFVSDHVCSLYANFAPFANLDVIQNNLYLYTQHDVSGVHAETWNSAEIKWAESDRLRAFVLARLLWNPDQVLPELRRDFIRAYYGPAAKEVSQFIEAFESARRDSDAAMRVDAPSGWLNMSAMESARIALVAALQSNAPSPFGARLLELQSTFEYAQLVHPPMLTEQDGKKVWLRGNSRPLDAVIERMASRNLGTSAVMEGFLARVREDCGGETPPRVQPYVEGQAPK